LAIAADRADGIRGLPRAAWVLFAGTFINRFGGFVLVFLALYITESGYTVAEAGIALSAYGIGGAAAALVGGHLADRIGRRAAIAVSMFSSAATMLALSQATSFGWIVALAALAGSTAELYRPASAALLADLTPPGERVTAFAMYRLFINAGYAAGPALAGFVAERSFTVLFVADAATSVAFGVVALTGLPATHRQHGESASNRAVLAAVRRDRAFLLFLVATALIGFIFVQAHTTLPLQVRALGLSAAAYGALMSLNGALILTLEVPFTFITRRLPPRPTIAVGFLLSGAGFALIAAAAGMPALALTVVIWSLGEILSMPVTGAYVADIAPPGMQGRYQGALALAFSIGLIIGPASGAWLFAGVASRIWALCGLLGAAAAALVIVADWPRTDRS
jgi:MFS family permease